MAPCTTDVAARTWERCGKASAWLRARAPKRKEPMGQTHVARADDERARGRVVGQRRAVQDLVVGPVAFGVELGPEDVGRAEGGDDGDLPAAFPHNVDTFSLAAAGALVAVGTPTGGAYVSADRGATWRTRPNPDPRVRSFATSWAAERHRIADALGEVLAALDDLPRERLGLPLHDTRGTALANALAACAIRLDGKRDTPSATWKR